MGPFLSKKRNATRAAVHFALGGLLVLSVLSLSPLAALGQTGTGAVIGTVRGMDQTPLANAIVKISNSDTNFSRRDTSSEEGVYYFGALPPGPYTVVAELSGFRNESRSFVLQVGQILDVDLTLLVGGPGLTVAVTAAADTSVAVADVKDYLRIRQLHIIGRVISLLFVLTHGVVGGADALVIGF